MERRNVQVVCCLSSLLIHWLSHLARCLPVSHTCVTHLQTRAPRRPVAPATKTCFIKQQGQSWAGKAKQQQARGQRHEDSAALHVDTPSACTTQAKRTVLGSSEGALPALTPVVPVPPLLRPKVPLIFSHRVPVPWGVGTTSSSSHECVCAPCLRPKVPLIFSHRVPAPHGHIE